MLLKDVTPADMKAFGRRLTYDYPPQFASFEAAAQQCVRDMYDTYRLDDGSPAFALLRIFRATRYADLPPEFQKLVSTMPDRALVLMATMGLEPAWHDRKLSRSHKAIAVDQHMSPMFKGIFHDLGIGWDEILADDIPKGQEAGQSMTRYFHVPEAREGGYITDQAQFVTPYGIRTVIAVGSKFVSGDAYVLIGFSRAPISSTQAKTVATLTPYLSTLLAIYDGTGRLWG